MTPAFLVPQGAEERAIRRAAPHATIVPVRAGAQAALLPENLPEGLIIVLGLCGALRTLRTGDCVIFSDIADEIGRYTFDAELVRTTAALLPSAKLAHGCTINHVVTRATERRALAAAYSAEAVDMEGTHIVRALAARGRAALIIRVVSDDPTYELPGIEEAFDSAGKIRPLHLALAFAAQPRAAIHFINDARRALRTLGTMAALLSSPSMSSRA